MLKNKWNQLKKQFLGIEEGMQIEFACISHLGKVRERNEDNLYYAGHILPLVHNREMRLKQWKHTTEIVHAVAVFDGMGGENAGDLASYTSASEFKKRFKNLTQNGQMPDQDQIAQMLVEVSDSVFRAAKEGHYKLIGSTATILFMKEHRGVIANLGDSPMYQVRDGKMRLLSLAHTDEELLKQQGVSRKPALTQFLGINTKEFLIEPYIREISIRSGDQYLLCSDGLTDMMGEEEIEQILTRECAVSEKIDLLLQSVLERGARDNTTMILCEVM